MRGIGHTVKLSDRLTVGFPDECQADNDHDDSIDDSSYHIWCPDVRGSCERRHAEVVRRAILSRGWGHKAKGPASVI